MLDYVIPGEVYAWVAVFILPVNSALNPALYTLTAVLARRVFMLYFNELTRISSQNYFLYCV